ncbi:hypothetical protein P7C70_g563, partial [Phenoliferia sp. Uapishka_3]
PRALFSSILTADLLNRSHRPSLILPTTQSNLICTTTLNDLLTLFISRKDWMTATLVLETFRVRRIEPNAATHSGVVLGVLKKWEEGKIRRGRLAEERGLVDRFEAVDEGQRMAEGGEKSLEMLRRLLRGRQMRMKLWVKKPTPTTIEEESSIGGEVDNEELEDDVEATIEMVPHDRDSKHVEEAASTSEKLPPPSWMLSRELRDLGYLISLLRRCSGLDDPDWAQGMARVRKEILPVGSGDKDHNERKELWKNGRTREERGKDLVRKGNRYRAGMRDAVVVKE